MRLKLLVVVMCAVALGVSGAFAAPPPGKGKPATAGKPGAAGKPSATGPTCRPKVTVVIKGTVTNAGLESLAMKVTQGNRWGRSYAGIGTATVVVNAATKVRGSGAKLLTDIRVNDRVLVQARVCKADLTTQAAQPALTAVRVVVHPAKA